MYNNNDVSTLEQECIKVMTEKGVLEGDIKKWMNINKNYDLDEYESLQGKIINKIINDEKGYFLKEDNGILYYINKEVYKLFCTDEPIYDIERQKFSDFADKAVVALATSLASSFGMTIALASGICSIFICGFVKIGKNAWCSYMAEEFSNDK